MTFHCMQCCRTTFGNQWQGCCEFCFCQLSWINRTQETDGEDTWIIKLLYFLCLWHLNKKLIVSFHFRNHVLLHWRNMVLVPVVPEDSMEQLVRNDISYTLMYMLWKFLLCQSLWIMGRPFPCNAVRSSKAPFTIAFNFLVEVHVLNPCSR